MESGFGKDFSAPAEGAQQPEHTGGEKPHWTAEPQKMLLAVLACLFFSYLLNIAVILLADPVSAGASLPEADLQGALSSALSTSLGLLVSILFYCLVRRAQRRYEAKAPVSWRIGVALWVGIPLTIGLFALSDMKYLLYAPASGSMNLLSSLVSTFSFALFFSLLVPSLQPKYGLVNSALIISASFALLALLEQLNNNTFFRLLYASKTGVMGGLAPWSDIARNVFSAFITSASIKLLSFPLYLAASRRTPGTWLLFCSVPGLLSLPYHALERSLSGSAALSGWLQTLCVEFPYYLLVFALSLAALAAFRRYKTFAEFAVATRALIKKAWVTVHDVEE